MAGIIGSMTAQARLRRGRKEVLSDKCVYELQPFDTHGFDPKVHNKYVWRRDESGLERQQKARREFDERQIEENEMVSLMHK